MRRFSRLAATMLGIITTAGLFTFAGTASAADGVLFVNGVEYIDPSGCIPINPDQHPALIRNHTDRTALVFLGPNCEGPVTHYVHPGHHAFTEESNSIFVP